MRIPDSHRILPRGLGILERAVENVDADRIGGHQSANAGLNVRNALQRVIDAKTSVCGGTGSAIIEFGVRSGSPIDGPQCAANPGLAHYACAAEIDSSDVPFSGKSRGSAEEADAEEQGSECENFLLDVHVFSFSEVGLVLVSSFSIHQEPRTS